MNVMCSCLVFLLVSSFCMVFIPLPDISDVCVEVTLQNLTKNSTNSTATNRVFELVHKGSDIGHFVDMVGFSFVAFCMQFATVTCDSIHTAVTLQSLGDANSGKIGNIRAWGSLGHGIGAIAIGSLVSTSTVSQLICGKMVQGTDYHYMFYLTAFFGAVTLANIPRIFKGRRGIISVAVEEISNGTNYMALLMTFKNLSWLFILFSHSVFLTITQGFLSWHLENIGASPYIIGASVLITTTVEFFMFFITPMLIRVLGHWKLVSAGMATYAVRFLAYAALVNPMYVLLIQIVEGVTFACQWSAIVSHLSNQVPEHFQTQVQGVMQALIALGMGISFPVSGALTQAFGTPRMFQIFAAMALIFLVIFITAQIVPDKRFLGTLNSAKNSGTLLKK
ncbi:major facilitator superfamily domain-containing protein 6-like isoform X1 [Liolophura sinensis]|uniref:major facilitator superfamily domain-containing protein 6-like isoform X1 n=1 Tax=Liolophura sinensis TaxID=3198878 RepID=UPI0031583B9C